MRQNKNLSEFTIKTKEKMGDVLGEEEYVEPIAKSLGKNCIESFKKFMPPKELSKINKKIQFESLGNELRNPSENKQTNTRKANEPELEH